MGLGTQCIVPKDQGLRSVPSFNRPMTIDARSIAYAHPNQKSLC